MAKKEYLKPQIQVFIVQHENVLAGSGGEKSPIPCVQFGGDEPSDVTAGEGEYLF